MATNGRADLHLHSTASDGALAPADVIEAAIAGGLDVVALADHDTTAGVEAAVGAAAGRIRVLPAVELSTTRGGAELHVLGYHIDASHPALADHAIRAGVRRHERVREILELLDGLGVRMEYAEVIEHAGAGAPGRPHIARALVAAGHVRSVTEAFDRWLADEAPAFVPTALASPRDAIAVIHEAGGLAVWAHPPLHLLEREIEGFALAGLDGVECYRPRMSAVDVARIERTARSYGLLLSGGSDWHGEWSGRLGAFAVPVDRVAGIVRGSRDGDLTRPAEAHP